MLGSPRPSIFLIMAVLIFLPTASDGADLDDQMNVSIRVRIGWDKQFDRTHEKGEVFVQVNGMLKLAEQDDQFMQYTPEGLNARYYFDYERVMTDPDDECAGKVIERETGSGSAKPQLDFQAMLGQSGLMHAMQYVATSGGALDPSAMMRVVAGTESFDAYTFMLVLPGVMNTIEKSLCPTPDTRDLPRSLMFQARCHKVTPNTLMGSYGWSSSVEWSPASTPPMEVLVGSCQGTEFRAPEEGGGDVRYQVDWTFGDVQPMVEIWREDDNITDETSDVVIGRKVKLKAKILPEGLEPKNGLWELDGNVIADYTADEIKAKVKRLGDKDLKKQEIEFYYIEGDFGGREIPVKWSGKVNNQDVEAEATMKVFSPKVRDRDLIGESTVSIGMYGKDCRMYAGLLTQADPPQGLPGMEMRHSIYMPPVDDTSNLLQYVQMMQEDMLMYYDHDYEVQVSEDWCLDTVYPANERKPTPDEAEFQDTPGPQLDVDITKEHHESNWFKTYLMFMPSSNKDDPDAIWIPVELIEWDWSGGALNVKQNVRTPPCDTTTFQPLYADPPDASPSYQQWPEHPKWDCNAKNTPKRTVTVMNPDQEKEWNDKLQQRRQRGQNR